MKQTFKKFVTIEQKNQWKDMQKQRVDQVMKDIFQKFRTEDFLDFASKQYLKSYEVPSDKWSLSNRFAMFLSGTSDARGYHQWNKVNRHVKKGSKAIYILAPIMKEVKREKKVFNKNTGKYDIEEDDFIVRWFKAIPVFRFEDTEGEELKYVEKPKQEIPLREVFEKFGLKIIYDRSIQGEYGSYDQQTKQIRICTPNVMTAFHELAHHVHSTIETLKAGQDKEQEIIAQLTAQILARIYNFEESTDLNYTFNYIKNYSDTTNRDEILKNCLRVISKIQKILDKIFNVIEESSITILH